MNSNLPASILIKKQTREYPARRITLNGEKLLVRCRVRYDDQCGNGHNTFSITGDYTYPGKSWNSGGGGCIHDEIAEAFPELAPLIKWHLCSSDGPMHYIANTTHHAKAYGPQSAWIRYNAPAATFDPLGIFPSSEHRLSCYVLKPDKALLAEGKPGYSVEWDLKTAKEANLNHARSSAIWPEATQEQLLDESALLARLPALMLEFKAAVESLGFVY